jgi:ribosomal protein L14E/L6E/L27E
VVIEGKGMKRKKTNMQHLEPLPTVLDIKKEDKNHEIVLKLEKENIV